LKGRNKLLPSASGLFVLFARFPSLEWLGYF
jgi:hypothetical protein